MFFLGGVRGFSSWFENIFLSYFFFSMKMVCSYIHTYAMLYVYLCMYVCVLSTKKKGEGREVQKR